MPGVKGAAAAGYMRFRAAGDGKCTVSFGPESRFRAYVPVWCISLREASTALKNAATSAHFCTPPAKAAEVESSETGTTHYAFSANSVRFEKASLSIFFTGF